MSIIVLDGSWLWRGRPSWHVNKAIYSWSENAVGMAILDNYSDKIPSKNVDSDKQVKEIDVSFSEGVMIKKNPEDL